MAYSTDIEVRNALAPGSFDDGEEPYPNGDETKTAADLSNEQLGDAILEADATIDSYIGGRYVVPVVNDAGGVPLAVTPIILNRWSRNIAAYNATLTYSKRQDFTDDDPVARRWKATMLALTAVRDGKAVIPGIEVNVSPSASAGAGTVINKYAGADMFQPSDFDLYYGYDWARGHSRRWC